jgi:hypothetical protein
MEPRSWIIVTRLRTKWHGSISGRGKDFCLVHCVQTGCEPYGACYWMSTGGALSGGGEVARAHRSPLTYISNAESQNVWNYWGLLPEFRGTWRQAPPSTHFQLNWPNYQTFVTVTWNLGRLIAQAVSRRLPTAVARVPARVGDMGFVMDKVVLGQVFSEHFGFSCQFSFHRLLHTHHLSSRTGTIGQFVADVPSGFSLTPPQETKRKTWNFEILRRKPWLVS